MRLSGRGGRTELTYCVLGKFVINCYQFMVEIQPGEPSVELTGLLLTGDGLVDMPEDRRAMLRDMVGALGLRMTEVTTADSIGPVPHESDEILEDDSRIVDMSGLSLEEIIELHELVEQENARSESNLHVDLWEGVRLGMVRVIKGDPDKAIAVVKTMASSDEPKIRDWTTIYIRHLMQARAEVAMQIWSGILKDPDEDVRKEAYRAIPEAHEKGDITINQVSQLLLHYEERK
ncbi:hypothetical protein [Amycolatopsis sp. NPDC051716]|uniref:hypothetical protein n=1 Tax=Amycolatopsis sp. NPDC051716 TaxID=3155804 RepID=UPI00343BC426